MTNFTLFLSATYSPIPIPNKRPLQYLIRAFVLRHQHPSVRRRLRHHNLQCAAGGAAVIKQQGSLSP